jgi:hypothetical protein
MDIPAFEKTYIVRILSNKTKAVLPNAENFVGFERSKQWRCLTTKLGYLYKPGK